MQLPQPLLNKYIPLPFPYYIIEVFYSSAYFLETRFRTDLCPSFQRLKLTCSVGSYLLENLHQTPQILTPSQLPSPHTLSLIYHLAMAGGSLKQLLENHSPTSSSKEGRKEGEEREAAALSLQPGDLESLRYLWPPSGLRECLSRFRDARSHSEVSFWLDHLTLISHCCHVQCGVSKTPSEREKSSLEGCEPEESCSKDWEEVFGRYVCMSFFMLFTVQKCKFLREYQSIFLSEKICWPKYFPA